MQRQAVCLTLAPARSRFREGAGRGTLPGQPCFPSSRALPHLAEGGGLRTLAFLGFYDSLTL